MPGLQITPTQLKSMEAARLEYFRTDMVKHLREDVAGAFAKQSDQQLLAYIDKGIKRAQAYGATDNDAFGLFIMLMTELGDDFDSNPAYPWAKQGLSNTAVKDATVRIRNVVAACSFYLSNLSNDANETATQSSGLGV